MLAMMAAKMTAAITMGVSLVRMELIISCPRPGMENTCSMTMEPPRATPRENLQNLLKFGSQFDNIEIK